MQKTRIIVIRMKEIIYTAAFIGAGIILLLLLIFILKPHASKQDDQALAKYNAGIYTSSMSLNNTTLNLEVTIDSDRITSIRLVNTDDAVMTMFPLLKPALKDLEEQIIEKQDTTGISLSDDSRYTQTLLISEIDAIIQKALTDPSSSPEETHH